MKCILQGQEEWRIPMKMFSNSNLLDNWYFVGGGSQQGGGQFPINQRGSLEYSGNYIYTVDRWRKGASGTISIANQGLIILPGDNIWQILESSLYSYLVGKQVTLSFLMGDGNFIYGTTTIPENDGSLKFAYFSDSPNSYFAVGGGNLPHIAIINNTSTNLVFCACKLELGPIQTLAHKDASGNWVLNDPPPNFALEQAKCQRYQLVGIQRGLYYGKDGYTNTTGSILFHTPVPLRILPQIIGTINLATLDSQSFTPTNIYVQEVTPNGVLVNYQPGNIECFGYGSFDL